MSEHRPFHRQQSRFWWGQKPYLAYTVRELSGVAVAIYGAVLLVGLICLVRGQATFDAYRLALASGWSMLVHLFLLVAVLWHVITWFQTMPKTMPKLILGGKQVPQQWMTDIGLMIAIVCSAALIAVVVAVGALS